jgi:alkylhydroperoxidase family enzyme
MLETTDEQILAVHQHEESDLFDEREHLALEYADCMTLSDREVSDELFARLAEMFDEETLIELTAVIAWENASSKFNRALRVKSQGLWKRAT